MFVKIMKEILSIINQFAQLESKLLEQQQDESIVRMLQRMNASWNAMGYTYMMPLGEKYNETRTDVVANIVGEIGSNMIITQVVKPVIYYQDKIVQQGIVMVESK
ncbi:MAG: hypothetical protein HYZ42_04320 [Bacteroidetes bacterium]|nr:hypothetical protein [Bacteroidota bacterium]